MKRATSTIVTVVTRLVIDEVEKVRDSIFETAFTTVERNFLAPRHIRSTAGWLALKKSIIQLAGENGRGSLSEKDIEITCLADGRPVIAGITSPAIQPGDLFVSISHTRTTAYGLAVLQEG